MLNFEFLFKNFPIKSSSMDTSNLCVPLLGVYDKHGNDISPVTLRRLYEKWLKDTGTPRPENLSEDQKLYRSWVRDYKDTLNESRPKPKALPSIEESPHLRCFSGQRLKKTKRGSKM